LIEEGPTLDEIHAQEKEEMEEKSLEPVSEEIDEVETESEEESESGFLESENDEVDYSSLTVSELKELLKAAGKPVSGKKADLIDRLIE